MRSIVFLLLVIVSVGQYAFAADAADSTSTEGIDLMTILEGAAHRLKKRFIIDPRFNGRAILINVDPEKITYAELQSILSVHGFVATQEVNGIVRIVPDANARQLPMPLLTGGTSKVGGEEMVTKVLDVSPLTATQLVPILRPLLPQYAHMVGTSETNTLVLVARKSNVEMIESIVNELRARPVEAKRE